MQRVDYEMKYAAKSDYLVINDDLDTAVNEVAGTRFGVNLIPHTLTATTWGRKKPGDEVNLEVDLFARYVARLMEFRP